MVSRLLFYESLEPRMRKRLGILILVLMVGALIASVSSAVATRHSPAISRPLVSVQSSATPTAQLQAVTPLDMLVPIVEEITFPEAGGLFLMGSGLLMGAIYLRRKILVKDK